MDASGISSVDLTASEELVILYHELKKRGIKFYITGHVSSVNDQLRSFGAMELIRDRVVRARIAFALEDAGLSHPYPAEEQTGEGAQGEKTYNVRMAEFDWAFGSDAEGIKSRMASEIAKEVASSGSFDMSAVEEWEKKLGFGYWNDADEEEFLDLFTMHVERLGSEGKISDVSRIEDKINARREVVESHLMEKNAELIHHLVHRRGELEKKLREKNPRAYENLVLEREKYFQMLLLTNPDLAKKIADAIADED